MGAKGTQKVWDTQSVLCTLRGVCGTLLHVSHARGLQRGLERVLVPHTYVWSCVITWKIFSPEMKPFINSLSHFINLQNADFGPYSVLLLCGMQKRRT